jgi:hypothetical protein
MCFDFSVHVAWYVQSVCSLFLSPHGGTNYSEAVFIVPYIQLVFTLETTSRALRSAPLPPRSKWTVAICLTVIKIALLTTGLVAFFIRAPDFCFASLFWFVQKWATGGFVLLISIVVILAVCAVIIYLKLTRYSMIEDDERVSASRMIYYITLAIIPNVSACCR